jgi:hypothetical protein
MTTRERRDSPVYRQLAAYRESWQKEHEAAMRCRDQEEVVAVGISTYRMLREREEIWREKVFRGPLPFDAEDDADQRERYGFWLEATEAVLRDILPVLEREFDTVEGAEQLRACAAEAKDRIRDWQSPRLSMAVGLREMTLSPEGAADLERILEDARGRPAETPPGPALRETLARSY